MGHFVNPGSRKFEMSLNSEIYVDKSDLIIHTNRLFDTERRFICISRPRRFGKTMAANLMAAYYGSGEDTHELFQDLKIANHPTYEKHLNQYHVLMLNIQEFLSRSKSVEGMLELLITEVTQDFKEIYPEINYEQATDFVQVMRLTYQYCKKPFVILIDEWDCLFREFKDDLDSQKTYLEFLRLWLKDQAYVGLAYMTGILPIKKYGTQSALNMFKEYSMTNPSRFLDYFGFSTDEVKDLCHQYGIDFSEMKNWYNGYFIELGKPIYSPKSVVSALEDGVFDNYWNKTETYESLRDYIRLDFDGLRDKVTLMLADDAVKVNINTFTNDMRTFDSADDVLALLIHLGYLAYHHERKIVRIPNEEVKSEFVNSMQSLRWSNVITAIESSNKLLHAIWNQDGETVAKGIEKVHEENTSILQYNDENSLSCVLSLALYGARDYYSIIRELPSGKGYADLVFLPRKKFLDKPAIVVELKWDQSVESAIDQIKQKNYLAALDEYEGNLLLVGMAYDKQDKSHRCVIEEFIKWGCLAKES